MSLEKVSDKDLVNEALGGDGDAFSELFNRYYTMIYAFAYRMCLSREDAEDVAQETFVKAARALGSLKKDGFKAWIYRIALNCCHDSNRMLGRKQRVAEAIAAGALEEKSGEDFGRVSEALAELASDQRKAVTLVFMEGMTHAEAAAVLGCAETTVSWRLYRAKRKLKRILERQR